MKKWITTAFIGAVMGITVTAVAMAQGEGVGSFCKPLADAVGVKNDLCVNCVNSGKDDLAVCMCKDSELVEGIPFLGYENLGQCIKAVHELGY